MIVGLALFLSLFVMAPTLSEINDDALQPLLKGEKTQGEAYDAAVGPDADLHARPDPQRGDRHVPLAARTPTAPETPDDVSLTALIPAFILSELKTAFIIGFVIFIPFLVIDIVVSSSLMSMGMMMLPPVFVSLPVQAAAVRHGRRLGPHRPLPHHQLRLTAPARRPP